MQAIDRPAWVSIPDINFKVRGLLLSHGVAYGVDFHTEKACILECAKRYKFKSFWDVGANFGYYSWMLKSINPELRVTLVEPLPVNARLIRSTISRYKFSDVAIFEAAASDHVGEGTLYTDTISGATSSLSNDGSFVYGNFGAIPEPISVRLIRLDSLNEEVDFVKIDVEGHEAEALKGAAGTITRSQPVVIVECTHPEQSCLRPLRDQGYHVLPVDESNLLCIPSKYDYRWTEKYCGSLIRPPFEQQSH